MVGKELKVNNTGTVYLNILRLHARALIVAARNDDVIMYSCLLPTCPGTSNRLDTFSNVFLHQQNEFGGSDSKGANCFLAPMDVHEELLNALLV